MNFLRTNSNESFNSKSQDHFSLASITSNPQSTKSPKIKQNSSLNSHCDTSFSSISSSKSHGHSFLNAEPDYDSQSLFSLIYSNHSKSYNKKIYNYPNLIKLNLNDFFEPTVKFPKRKYKPIERLKNTTIIIHDDTEDTKQDKFDVPFTLNPHYSESRFHSETEINDFFHEKLDQLEKYQEIEIKEFIRNWEKEQINASLIDFQDYCYFEGTKMLLTDDKIDLSRFKAEENLNLKKVNHEHEQLFEKMSQRHEKEIELLVNECDRQITQLRSMNITDIDDELDESEISPFSSICDKSSISHLSSLENCSNISLNSNYSSHFPKTNKNQRKSLSQSNSPRKPTNRKAQKTTERSIRPLFKKYV